MTDRDDANIRHFLARSSQPRVLVAAPVATVIVTGTRAYAHAEHDQGFGTSMNQIDDMRFKYMGASPKIYAYQRNNNRKNIYASMQAGM